MNDETLLVELRCCSHPGIVLGLLPIAAHLMVEGATVTVLDLDGHKVDLKVDRVFRWVPASRPILAPWEVSYLALNSNDTPELADRIPNLLYGVDCAARPGFKAGRKQDGG